MKERKVVNQARDKGHIAFRSAGSHSPVDVVILEADTRRIKLIQCKPNSMSDNQKKKLRNEMSAYNGQFEVEFEVI